LLEEEVGVPVILQVVPLKVRPDGRLGLTVQELTFEEFAIMETDSPI